MSGIVFDSKLLEVYFNRSVRRSSDGGFFSVLGSISISEILGGFERRFDTGIVLGRYPFKCVSCVDTLINKISYYDNYHNEQLHKMIPDNGFDILLSNMLVHMSDNPSILLSLYKSLLNSGGLMICTVAGQESLKELKNFIADYEVKVSNRYVPRVIPMISAEIFSDMLHKVGFQVSVVSKESYKLEYDSVLKLINDIRDIGQSNCMSFRHSPALKKSFYQTCIDSKISTTFDILVFVCSVI